MKSFFLILVATLITTNILGQTIKNSQSNLELTERNLKRLFSIRPNICCPAPPPEWIACYNNDSAYNKADTIRLFSDQYYYLTKHCCNITSWNFESKTTFSLIETKVCQEPPVSSIHWNNSALKIKFHNKDNILTMSVYKKRKLKDKFILISLENYEAKNSQPVYQLTMLRIRK
jgi:hypothetical protein